MICLDHVRLHGQMGREQSTPTTDPVQHMVLILDLGRLLGRPVQRRLIWETPLVPDLARQRMQGVAVVTSGPLGPRHRRGEQPRRPPPVVTTAAVDGATRLQYPSMPLHPAAIRGRLLLAL